MGNNQECVGVEEARLLVSDPRYVIDEFIGSGAMACVYKVHERGTPNVYALKLLRENFWKRDRFKEIFEREARHMRDLQYPNIVRFYKFVADEQSAYILMDFVEGKPLTRVIRDIRQTGESVPLDKIIRIMAQIARAISYLHAEGFIHRDVKPGNVLLAGQNESAFLTDLGIAGAIDEPSMSGAGTPSYMPYEQQVRGKIDHTVDVYAFGIMLYELFTGHKPFQPPAGLSFNEARKQMVELHRKAVVPNISDRRDDLPPEVNQYFQRALAKNPSERYGDILDFAKDIHEAVLNQLPDDLRIFNNIQAQEITRLATEAEVQPVVVVQADSNRLDARVIAGGLVAIVAIIGLMVVLLQTVGNSDDAVNPESTLVLAAESTESVATISTPIPVDDTAETSVESFLLVEGVDAVGYRDTLMEAVRYVATVRDGVVPLQVSNDIRLFEVNFALADDAVIGDYQVGLLFNQVNEDNFLRIVIDGVAEEWRLVDVTDAEVTILDSGTLTPPLPNTWSLRVLDETVTITLDGEVTAAVPYTDTIQGAIALWMPPLEGDVLPVEAVTVNLVGEDAIIARETQLRSLPSPPANALLRDDVAALVASGDQTALVDCTVFDRIYDQLDAHRVIDGINDIIDRVQASSTVIASRCQVESDNDEVEFSFSDYLSWEDALMAILDEFDNE